MRIAFPTDEHRPFHDGYAIEVAQQIVRDFNPDELIVGSDGMDFYQVSKFNKNPERIKINLQVEIDEWQKGQREWSDAAPNAKKRYLVGNHEDRLRNYLWMHPEIASLKAMQLHSLLDLEALGIEWEHDKGLQANREINYFGKLVVKHGKVVRKYSSYSAKAELENEFYSISVLSGHTHRGGSHYVNTRNGIVQAHEGFCLCRLDPEYISNPNWQQGIFLGNVDGDGFSPEPVLIHDYSKYGFHKRAVWRGKEYLA